MTDSPSTEELHARLMKAENKIQDLENKLTRFLTRISQAADPRSVNIRDHNQLTIHGFGVDDRN